MISRPRLSKPELAIPVLKKPELKPLSIPLGNGPMTSVTPVLKKPEVTPVTSGPPEAELKKPEMP